MKTDGCKSVKELFSEKAVFKKSYQRLKSFEVSEKNYSEDFFCDRFLLTELVF